MTEIERNALLIATAVIFSRQAQPDHQKALSDALKLRWAIENVEIEDSVNAALEAEEPWRDHE